MSEESGLASLAFVDTRGLGGSHQLMPEFEAIKIQILGEIEARLGHKDESLWRRGQVEIQKLQREQQQVRSAVDMMQERQASLIAETQKIRGALLDVTSKFELVVSEMRQVLRVQRQHGSRHRSPPARALSPSPSVASTSASPQSRGRGVHETRSAAPTPGASSTCTPVCATGSADCSVEPFAEDSGCGSSSRRQTPRSAHAIAVPQELAHALDAESMMPQRVAESDEGALSGGVASMLGQESHVLLTRCALGPARADATAPTSSCDELVRLAQSLGRRVGAIPFGGSAATEGLPPSPVSFASQQSEPDFVRVELVKEDGFVTLGIEVNQVDGTCLRVEGIDDHGLVARYNSRQENELSMVHVYDCIVDVNGVTREPLRMLQECKTQQRLALVLAREKAALGVGSASGSAATEAPCVEQGSTALACNMLQEPQDLSCVSISERRLLKATQDSQKFDVASLLLPSRLRPDAQEFVPCYPTETACNSFVLPPGLGRHDLGSSADSSLLSDPNGFCGDFDAVGHMLFK
eukprot:TRINITY_DN69467_c0_g1_i1.p1 TRINITY_DN69467_c0_g1~~TRINITY_DN69467_c0_g1_i1.p1  ORF type:complete len:525 (+),score=91.34 TRINITY_DN69467_c0_g1_i1:96-1670(+)